ncbi:MAG: hypothetical protein IIC91_10445 [Chloroflexi bacterium]|nr:hypothetical protein [Chloroflexota bacterium]
MEAEVTVTVTMKVSRSRVQALLADLGIEGEGDEVQLRSEDPGREAIGRFLVNLTRDGRRVVERISKHSAEGDRVYRDDLAGELGIDAGLLNGFLGGVGKWSSRGFGSEKPFAGKRETNRGDVYYLIDPKVAEAILDELAGLSLPPDLA